MSETSIVENLLKNIDQTNVDTSVFKLLQEKLQPDLLTPAVKKYIILALELNSSMYSSHVNTLIPKIFPKEIDFIMELINTNKFVLKPLLKPKIYSLLKSIHSTGNPTENVAKSTMYKEIQKEVQDAHDLQENLKKNISEYWNMRDKPREQVKPITTGTICLLGDIEGDATMIYSWFLHMKYIDTALNWIAPDNVWVIQLGDQVDIRNRRTRSQEQLSIPDYYVIVFFDYLNLKSNGRVMSVLGNHEMMNLDFNFNYVLDQHKQKRIELFSKDGIIYNILKRRNYILKLGPLLCCHAGLTQSVIEYIMSKHETNSLEQLVNIINAININEYPKDSHDQTYSVVWTREYMNTSELTPKPLSDWMQEYLTNHEVSMVIGHNSYKSVFYCSNASCSEGFTTEKRLIQVDTGVALESCKPNTLVSNCMVSVVDEKLTAVQTIVFEWNCPKSQTVPDLLSGLQI